MGSHFNFTLVSTSDLSVFKQSMFRSFLFLTAFVSHGMEQLQVSDDDQVQDGVQLNIDDPKKSGNDTDREGRLSYRTGYTGPHLPIWHFLTTFASKPLILCNAPDTVADLKVIKKIKKVKSKKDCKKLCTNENDFGIGCQYFNYKSNKKLFKRMCYLLKVEEKKKKG